MQRLKTTGLALLAVLAISAMASGTASAAKPKLDMTWEGETHQLAPGEEFRMNNETQITIATENDTVTCKPKEGYPDDQGLNGVDETNDQTTDKVSLHYSYGAIGDEQACEAFGALGREAAEARWYSESSPMGTLSLTAPSTVDKSGKVTFKAQSKSQPMYIAFYIAATGVACYYTTTGLTGTLKLEEYYEDEYQMAINFENQRLKLYKPDSNKACSKSGTITAPFAFQSREMSSERAWYILGKLVG